ncbi:MAG: AAA family ATPase [Alphaproteobacteria bacterium]|nr:MAG: AAA family ATPase [Alphaproteobacteria bacterium]
MDDILRKRALENDNEALMELTKTLIKEEPLDAKNTALDMLQAAWTGDPAAAYQVGMNLLTSQESPFHRDKDLGILWLRRADKDNNEDAKKALPGAGQVDMGSYKDPIAEMNALIGLTNVKKAVMDQADRVAYMRLREKQGLPVSDAAVHMVFTGNPGTGKTSVARLFGRILRRIGYLKSGHLVEVSVPQIIGRWVGETPQKVVSCVNEALDGVLFIDEAYGLMGHTTHTGNSYGAEAVTTLLKLMEDNRDRLVVIVAGYPAKMAEFLESNPGLKSRFTEILHFGDYSPQEMADIYLKLAKEGQYTLNPAAQARLAQIMAEAPRLYLQNFPNGRLVRNLFEDTIKYAASRVMKLQKPGKSDLTTFTETDLDQAFRELNQHQ